MVGFWGEGSGTERIGDVASRLLPDDGAMSMHSIEG